MKYFCAPPVRAALLLPLIASFTSPVRLRSIPHNSGRTAQTTESHLDEDSVQLTVTVTDKKGNYIGGLTRDAFTLYDKKVPQKINYFSAKDEPVSVGIILDFSMSVAGHGRERLSGVRAALLRFIQMGNSANKYFVISFANRPRLLIDWTDSRGALEGIGNADHVPVEGTQTALYDSCYLAIEKMRGRASSRRALLLVSDGQDSFSSYTFKDVREGLKESGVVLYSIGILGSNDAGSSLGLEGQAVMTELSSASGGVAVFPDDKRKINALFEQIAIELRNQYLIGFTPSIDQADGKWHQLKLKLTPPPNAPPSMSKLLVRSREGYYALKRVP